METQTLPAQLWFTWPIAAKIGRAGGNDALIELNGVINDELEDSDKSPNKNLAAHPPASLSHLFQCCFIQTLFNCI